jgi:hypothetical protein
MRRRPVPPARSVPPEDPSTFLGSCSPAAAKLLAMLGDEVRPQPGEVLTKYTEEDQETVFVVLEGAARVERGGRPAKHVGRGNVLWVGRKTGVTVADTEMRLLRFELSAFEGILEAGRDPAANLV